MSDPFGQAADADRYDIDFAVPQVHRLRFTRDCFGEDFAVLRELLQPSSHGMARVQVWRDQGLADWDATLPHRITEQLTNSSGLVFAVDLQTLPGGGCVKN